MKIIRCAAVVLALSAAIANAADIRVGALEGNPALFIGGSDFTIIDMSRPANGTGNVNTASVGWTGATVPCDNIFFVRFFAIASNSLSSTFMTAERGPFRAVDGINTVTLDPPVAVTPETYIAIRR